MGAVLRLTHANEQYHEVEKRVGSYVFKTKLSARCVVRPWWIGKQCANIRPIMVRCKIALGRRRGTKQGDNAWTRSTGRLEKAESGDECMDECGPISV